MFSSIRNFLIRFTNALKFRAICKATGIKPYQWQREYVLNWRPMPSEVLDSRATGKTTAVMLRMLMFSFRSVYRDAAHYFSFYDPDYREVPGMKRWYLSEYSRLSRMCIDKGIRVHILQNIRGEYYLVPPKL